MPVKAWESGMAEHGGISEEISSWKPSLIGGFTMGDKSNKRSRRVKGVDEHGTRGRGKGAEYCSLAEIPFPSQETQPLPVLADGKHKVAVAGGEVESPEPPACPFCAYPAELVTGKEVYKDAYYHNQRVWLCRPCDSYVGCHKGTKRPLGELADKETREARKRAHLTFDPLWKKGYMTRSFAYGWMRKQMGLTKEASHIAMMTKEQCYQLADMAVALLRILKNP